MEILGQGHLEAWDIGAGNPLSGLKEEFGSPGALKFSEKEQRLSVPPRQSALSLSISTGPIWLQPSK